jgi:hypothetical protein
MHLENELIELDGKAQLPAVHMREENRYAPEKEDI